MANPFRNRIVMDPWDPNETDVPEIHRAAFDLVCETLSTVKREKRSSSVLLHGEPGSGKTHLLRRLRAHVKTQENFQVFVSVRLQSNPNRLWRHIRTCFVENLIRPVISGWSQIERIFLGRLYRLCHKKIITVSELHELLDVLIAETNVSRDMCKALESLVRNRHRMDVVAWLKGDSLPETAVERMGIAPESEDGDDPEDLARQFVQQLCRLAGPEIPVVLCFDQVEALQRYRQGDPESLFIFGQAIGTLHDTTSNVLLVSCIQSSFLDLLKDAVMKPDYDRLSVHLGTLNPITRDPSLKIITARLQGCADLPENRRKELSQAYEKDLQAFIGSGGETARRVLSRCADLFDSLQKGESFEEGIPVSGVSDEEFLQGEKMRRDEQAIENFRPENTDDVIQTAVPVLLNILKDGWRERDHDRPRDMDVILEGPDTKVGISLCNQKNMTSLAGRLKRLHHQFRDSDINRLVLIRHPELPIGPGARKTRAYLENLEEQNVRFIRPDTEVLAALDALRSLLADARAGDLANGGRTLSDGTVKEWLKTHLEGTVLDFLDGILEDRGRAEEGDAGLLQELLSLLDRERLVRLEDAARELKTDMAGLRNAARRQPGQIGYLEGPPPVLFQFIPQSVQTW